MYHTFFPQKWDFFVVGARVVLLRMCGAYACVIGVWILCAACVFFSEHFDLSNMLCRRHFIGRFNILTSFSCTDICVYVSNIDEQHVHQLFIEKHLLFWSNVHVNTHTPTHRLAHRMDLLIADQSISVHDSPGTSPDACILTIRCEITLKCF